LAAGYTAILNGFRILSGVVIFSVFVLIVTDVLMRLFGLSPWTYISGIVEYGLLWFTMLAAPYLVRAKGHVFIDALIRLLSPRMRRVFAIVTFTICVCSCAVFAWFSLQLLIQAITMNLIDTRGEDMPLWTLLVPMPVGFALVAVEFTRFLFGYDDMYGSRTDVRDNV